MKLVYIVSKIIISKRTINFLKNLGKRKIFRLKVVLFFFRSCVVLVIKQLTVIVYSLLYTQCVCKCALIIPCSVFCSLLNSTDTAWQDSVVQSLCRS